MGANRFAVAAVPVSCMLKAVCTSRHTSQLTHIKHTRRLTLTKYTSLLTFYFYSGLSSIECDSPRTMNMTTKMTGRRQKVRANVLMAKCSTSYSSCSVTRQIVTFSITRCQMRVFTSVHMLIMLQGLVSQTLFINVSSKLCSASRSDVSLTTTRTRCSIDSYKMAVALTSQCRKRAY